MEADFGRDFLETSNKILKTTDRICKIALSLNGDFKTPRVREVEIPL